MTGDQLVEQQLAAGESATVEEREAYLADRRCRCGHGGSTHNPYVPQMGCRGHHSSRSATSAGQTWPCSCVDFTPSD